MVCPFACPNVSEVFNIYYDWSEALTVATDIPLHICICGVKACLGSLPQTPLMWKPPIWSALLHVPMLVKYLIYTMIGVKR
jgi:hypothetical protein